MRYKGEGTLLFVYMFAQRAACARASGTASIIQADIERGEKKQERRGQRRGNITYLRLFRKDVQIAAMERTRWVQICHAVFV